MVMTPFHDVCPEIAESETRTVTLLAPQGRLPADTYAFVEVYCILPGCPCQNVLLNVYDRNHRHLATINHALQPGGAFGDEEDDDDLCTFLDPFNPQSPLADDILDLFRSMVCLPAYEERLRRHREMVRRRVDQMDAGGPADGPAGGLADGAARSAAPAPRAAQFAATSREGRNKPCPCGSGRKLKVCCEREDAASQGAAPDGSVPTASTRGPASRASSQRGLAVVEALEEAGISTTWKTVPSVAIRLDGAGRVAPAGETITVVDGARVAVVEPPPISELFAGDRVPPDFSDGPTDGYVEFFGTIEHTALDFCATTGMRVRDQEFEKMYEHLRRRPDGTHPHPLFSYLQGAVRVYMSVHRVSRAEFEAVIRRLVRSARTFAMGPTSANYLDFGLMSLVRPSFGD